MRLGVAQAARRGQAAAARSGHRLQALERPLAQAHPGRAGLRRQARPGRSSAWHAPLPISGAQQSAAAGPRPPSLWPRVRRRRAGDAPAARAPALLSAPRRSPLRAPLRAQRPGAPSDRRGAALPSPLPRRRRVEARAAPAHLPSAAAAAAARGKKSGGRPNSRRLTRRIRARARGAGDLGARGGRPSAGRGSAQRARAAPAAGAARAPRARRIRAAGAGRGSGFAAARGRREENRRRRARRRAADSARLVGRFEIKIKIKRAFKKLKIKTVRREGRRRVFALGRGGACVPMGEPERGRRAARRRPARRAPIPPAPRAAKKKKTLRTARGGGARARVPDARADPRLHSRARAFAWIDLHSTVARPRTRPRPPLPATGLGPGVPDPDRARGERAQLRIRRKRPTTRTRAKRRTGVSAPRARAGWKGAPTRRFPPDNMQADRQAGRERLPRHGAALAGEWYAGQEPDGDGCASGARRARGSVAGYRWHHRPARESSHPRVHYCGVRVMIRVKCGVGRLSRPGSGRVARARAAAAHDR